MTSSPSPFANGGKLQVLSTPTTLLFTPSMNNHVTINNMGNPTQNFRQMTTQNGTILQQPMSNGTITTPTSIVRLNQSQTMQQNHGQFTQQTIWSNSNSPSSQQQQQQQQHHHQQQFTIQKTNPSTPIVHYTTVKNEPVIPNQQQQQQHQQQLQLQQQLQQHQHHQQQQQQHQTSIMPAKVTTQPVIRQTVGASQATVYTESQINDFVSKCRTFLTTLLRLAEKQAPEKLPMVKSCIQELLDGSIDPEAFTQRLHTLYKSQPHTSLVPFFRLALPHMRQIVMKRFGRPINIDLLDQLQLPPSNHTNNATNIATVNNTQNQGQGANSNVLINQSILTQQQQPLTPVVQQPLYTTVQTQQKINLLPSTSQTPLIGSTASLLSQQQQLQQQARTQIITSNIRPLVTSLSTAANPGLLSVQQQHQQQQHVQSVSQMIIQPTDSLLQRSILSSPTTNNIAPQTQIISVNPQMIKTETIHTQPTSSPSISSIQQRNMIKTEDDYVDDHNHANLGETRHLTRDDRLIPGMMLRRRLRELAEKDKRIGTPMLNDDAALALISHAAQERLKFLLEQVKLIAQHRIDLSMKNDPAYQQTSDVKSQIRFLEDLDKIEKQKKDKLEQEKIFRAAKSRSKTNDPEAAQLKKKAKEIHMAQVEEQRQKEANETALAAIGKPKKRKLEESTNHPHQNTVMSSNGMEQISPIQPSPSSGVVNSTNVNSKSRPTKRICRANLRDLLLIMERDKYLKRSTLLVRALNK